MPEGHLKRTRSVPKPAAQASVAACEYKVKKRYRNSKMIETQVT